MNGMDRILCKTYLILILLFGDTHIRATPSAM